MNRQHLFLLSLLQISTLLPLSVARDSPEYAECSNVFKFPCGSDPLNISYPFIVDGRPDYCGFPGHHITCVGDKPVMQLDGHGYIVKGIHYRDGVITLAERMISTGGDSCPVGVGSTVVDPSLFDFAEGSEPLWLFHCRNFSPESDGNVSRINCSPSGSGLQWYLMSPAEEFPFQRGWLQTAKIWLNRTAVEGLRGGRASFADALSRGFTLCWKAGDGWCHHCLRSGGVCGYTSIKPFQQACFCRNGTRQKSCTTVLHEPPDHRSVPYLACPVLLSCSIGFEGGDLWLLDPLQR